MEAEKRTLKRKPLFDCTNIISSSSSSVLKPKKLLLSTPKPATDSTKYDTSTGSNHAENPNVQPQPHTPPLQKTSANSGAGDYEKSEIVTVYRRKQTLEKRKHKGKAVVVASSCPPARRVRSVGHKLNEEHRDDDLSKMCTVSRPKHKQKLRYSLLQQGADQHALPQDFIERQRAYFAEVDAFELPEEAVAESELE